jgi:peptidyl-prolyl cis-trans isomerase SurA
VVNSEPITNELAARVQRVRKQLAGQNRAMPPEDALTREVLENLIVEKVQLQAAQQAGISVADLAIDQAEASVAQQNDVSKETMFRKLRPTASPPSNSARAAHQLVLQRLREREIDARAR